MTKPLKLVGKPARVLSDRELERIISARVRVMHLDYETFCEVDLTRVGLDVYSAHPSCRVLMAAYRINTGPLKQWFPHLGPMPKELRRALKDPKTIKWAFNAQFERVITKRVLKIKTPIRGWRCTQVLSYMHCFAGGLAEIGKQIGLPEDKLKLQMHEEFCDLLKIKPEKRKGTRFTYRLLHTFTMPNKVTKNQPHRIRDWNTDPELWEIFCRYNIQDVVAEESILKCLNSAKYPVPEFEWEIYELDQIINDRGIPVDIHFINNIIEMSARRKRELLARMEKITGVRNANSTAQLLPWLQDNGYPHSDLKKENVEKALKLKLPRMTVKVLKLRQWACLTSVTKAKTAKLVIGAGNCVRYMLQFGGASRTLRWAGRKVQTQNMKKTPKMLDAEEDDTKLRLVTDLIRQSRYEDLELMVGEPMLALSGCMRSMFRTPEGEDFVTGDLKSIESAVIAWVTNCKRLLKVFHDNRDPYRDFGMEFYRKAYDDITRAERNICKPPALGCGFRLGPGQIFENGRKSGLLAYAENMGIPMTVEETKHAVEVYRDIYEEIPDHWKLYEKAILRTMVTGKDTKVGPVTFELRKPYLTIALPSGRRIYYFRPKMVRKTIHTGKFKTVLDRATGQKKRVEETYVKRVFMHMGRDNAPGKSNLWTPQESHGGVIIENIVQAIARDVLAVCLIRLHAAGFRLVGHAHDEAIARARRGDKFTWQAMCDVMKQEIDWAPGLPLGAAGWSGPFYRK